MLKSSILQNKSLTVFLSIILVASITSVTFNPNPVDADLIYNETPIPNPNTSGSDFGFSITDVNGNFAVGAPGNNGGVGEAFLFSGADGSLICSISPTGLSPGDRFGEKVGRVGTSGLFVVGIPGVNGGLGQIRIYDSTCNPAGIGTISNPDTSGKIGATKITSFSNSEILVGNPTAIAQGLSQAGKLYRFNVITGATTTYDAGTSAQVGGQFGFHSSVLGPIRTLVGSPGVDKAFIISHNTGGNILATINDPEGATSTDKFGWSTTKIFGSIAISAPFGGLNDGGAFYLFSDQPPYAFQATINSESPDNGDQFGFWVASDVSGSENSVLVGAPFDDTTGVDSGTSYLYKGVPSIAIENPPIDNFGISPVGDNFGYAVDFVENSGIQYLLIGAPKVDAGVVYYILPQEAFSASTSITGNGQSLELTIDPNDPNDIDMRYFVENTGATDFSIDTISAAECSPLGFVGGDISPTDGLVNPGEIWEYQCDLPVPTSNTQESLILEITDTGFPPTTLTCFDQDLSCATFDITLGSPSLQIISSTQNPDPTLPSTITDVTFTVKNTGNVDLTDVTVTNNDPKILSPNCDVTTVVAPGDGDIAPGETETFACQTSSLLPVSFTTTASGTTPYSGLISANSPFMLNVGIYSMDISSNFSPANPISPNDPVTVTFTLTNDGTLPITNIAVTTDDSGSCANPTVVSPGDGNLLFGETETYQCTTSYATAQTVTLTATVSSTELPDQTHQVDDIIIGESSLLLAGSFLPPNPIPSNDPITVTFTVTNDGDFDLTNTVLSTNDPKAGSPNCANPTVVSPGDGNLSVGESETYQCTTNSPSSISLVGSVTATDSFSNPVGPETVQLDLVIGGASMSILGIADENPSPPSGTSVTFTVTNTGSLDLVNVIVTTDYPGDCSIPTIVAPGTGSILTGQSQDYTCNTGPISGDISIISTVNAEDEFSNPLAPVSSQLDIEISAPSISILGNNVPPSPVLQETTATFDWTVSNDGNVPIADLTFASSPVCENGVQGPLDEEDPNNNGLLDLTEVWTFFDCQITFNDSPGSTSPVTATFTGTDESGEVSLNIPHTTQMLIANPLVGLTISSDPTSPIVGEDTTLTFTVENTGNVDLDQPLLTMLTPFPSTNPIITSCNQANPVLLMPGQTFDFTCDVQFTTSGTNTVNAQIEISISPTHLPGNPIFNTDSLALEVSEPVSDVTLVSIIRDFKQSHPDMEQGCSGPICTGVKTGLVQNTLGLDGNPVFNEDIDSTHGPVNFNQWYNPVTGINQCADYNMVLTFDETSGKYTFTNGGISEGFFPIDYQLFGNEGKPHNYHFTMESKATFTYQSGLYFKVNGADDDTFIFINGKLAIDLGGTHPQNQATATINLDDPMLKTKLGLVDGQQATFSLFFAERQQTGSHLAIETNIPFTGVNQGQCDAPANSAELSITKTGELVSAGPSTQILTRTIIQGSDDAEQDKNDMDLDSSDLDLNEKDYVGLRFQNIDIPNGATITNAYVTFTVEDPEGDTGKAEVRIYAEDTDNASTFTNSKKDISSRKTTSAKVDWDIPNWNSAGQNGAAQTTPNISALIQEVIDRNGWQDGNSIALIFDSHKGNNDRDAKAYDSYPSMSAKLVVEFESDSVIDSNLEYTVTITNNGPESANNVIVIDDLPEEVTAISVLPSECEIVDDHTVSCDFSTLSVGQDKTITIVTEVESGFTGTITNNASVESSKSDPYLGNNQVSLETTIGGTAELFCGQPESFYDKVIYGTERADKLKGTNGNDLIFGYGGPDKIHGYKGNDCIYGGSGNDKIYGHNGMDTIFGEEGNDRIYGNNDDDVLSGGEGRDYLRGGYGVDQISGGSDRDNIRGGQGDDSLSGDSGDDNIHGGSGDDFIDGGADTDLCKGGSGSNTIINCEQDDKKKDKDEDDDDD